MSEIAKALIIFQSKCSVVHKNATNPRFKSKYADLEQIIKDTRGPLKEANLAFSQGIKIVDGIEILITELLHASGETKTVTAFLGSYGTIQEKCSLMTYLRRYQLISILGISGGDADNDGNDLVDEGQSDQGDDKTSSASPVKFTFKVIKALAGREISSIDRGSLQAQHDYWCDKSVQSGSPLALEIKTIKAYLGL